MAATRSAERGIASPTTLRPPVAAWMRRASRLARAFSSP